MGTRERTMRHAWMQSLAAAVFSMTINAVAVAEETRPPVLATRLRCEYQVDPVGIGVRQPRLSWQLTAEGRGVVQAAYQVRVAESETGLEASPIWDTGRVGSDRSIHVVYQGPALGSGRRYYWQGRVWDGHGTVSDWRVPAPRAYVTSLGLYEVELNGRRVGDQVFTPGWTSYDTRLQYQTYDVTGLLQAGDNAIAATLADGLYRGYLTWDMRRNVYGEYLALLLQLQITYPDGRVQIVGSDASWRAATGPIRMADLYAGERYDARRRGPP